MSGEAVADRRLHPGTIAIRFIKDAPQTLIGLPAAFAFISESGLERILLAVLAAGAILAFFLYLAWRRFRYGVGRSEILIESGIVSRNRRSIPFDRIQDLDIERGPLHRLFGLAKVKIETGAGGKDEGVLDSITFAEADRLRQAIRAGRAEPAALGSEPHAAPEVDSRTLYAMSPAQVLASGLFNFSLIWVAGLFGVLQTFDELLPYTLDNVERWIGFAGEQWNGRIGIGAIVAGLLVAGLLGLVAGVLRTAAQDWGFRLLDQGKRLRRVRGLFTRTEIVLPKRRVQLALVRTGPLRERLGLAELMLQTLGSSKGQGGLQSVAPFAQGPDIEAIVGRVPRLRLPGDTPMQRVSNRHVLRVAARTISIPAAIILANALWRPELLALLLLLPLLLGHAVLRRRYHLYGKADGFLFVTAGFWRRRLWALPMANVQTVSLSRSPLQRWLGLATLTIDTAGAPIMGGPRIVDLPLARAVALRDEIRSALLLRRGPPS